MKWLALSLGLAVAGVLLHRLAIWMETKGWIFYRTTRMPAGAAANAMLELEKLWNPPVEHILEIRRNASLQAQPNGEPEPGS